MYKLKYHRVISSEKGKCIVCSKISSEFMEIQKDEKNVVSLLRIRIPVCSDCYDHMESQEGALRNLWSNASAEAYKVASKAFMDMKDKIQVDTNEG